MTAAEAVKCAEEESRNSEYAISVSEIKKIRKKHEKDNQRVRFRDIKTRSRR